MSSPETVRRTTLDRPPARLLEITGQPPPPLGGDGPRFQRLSHRAKAAAGGRGLEGPESATAAGGAGACACLRGADLRASRRDIPSGRSLGGAAGMLIPVL
ncbi:hypothetical protein CMUS01_02896 [Colletotrichum musicola]|uniref:Uncharacterized protein n=1 Tax=Colletotrichum musicola TaxID=2175873 RepID=A0A8H6NUE0_9PEZI|nr:hypothetical protein CMUS01_02896 [Colletotrichum musicola]